MRLVRPALAPVQPLRRYDDHTRFSLGTARALCCFPCIKHHLQKCSSAALASAHKGCILIAGTLMFGGKDPAALDGAERTANLELCRLAFPRRVYTQSHMEYVLEIAQIVAAEKDTLQGYQIVQQPQFLRHFSATLAPLGHQHSDIVPFPASAGSGNVKEGTAAVSE